MTFLEFLDAVGKGGLRRLLDEKTDLSPFPLPFHEELGEWLKRYFIVGGCRNRKLCGHQDKSEGNY